MTFSHTSVLLYETVDSLRKRLQSMYAQVDVGSLKSIAWFICRKAD